MVFLSPFSHCVAISLKRARLLRFSRNDNSLNRNFGPINVLTIIGDSVKLNNPAV